MISFGRGNPFPYTLGGGDSDIASIHAALLDAYAPGWDVDDATSKAAEAYAQAVGVSFIWAASRRGGRQGQALKMVENLPIWEEACELRPAATDRVSDRRRALASHLRGLTDNTLAGIEGVARAILGSAFIAVQSTAPADEIAYWPGIYPGPPGFEWSSNRLAIAIRFDDALINPADLAQVLGALERTLESVVPAWMIYNLAGGDGFIVGESLLGVAGL